MLRTLKIQTIALTLGALTANAQGAMTDEQLDIKIDQETGIVHLTAVSTGCTKAEHFRLSRSSDGDITAVRERPDRCRRKAFEISFEYALEEIPLADDEPDLSQG